VAGAGIASDGGTGGATGIGAVAFRIGDFAQLPFPILAEFLCRPRGFTLGDETRLMYKLKPVPVLTTLLVSAGLIGGDARSAALEGALQYPPLSVGEDAQPPPPARMIPPSIVSPWRIELGVSGSSVPPNTQQFFIRLPIRSDQSGSLVPTGSGGSYQFSMSGAKPR
jgi:hypothetical protein